jgi:LEA14-like dessication related protein
MHKLLILVLVGLAMSSCRALKDPVFKGIGNVQVKGIGLGQSDLLVDMTYFNPNQSRGKLKEAQGEAWMDSIYLGHFTVDSTVNIPANADFIVPVRLIIKMKNILKNSFSLFMKNEVTIRLEGEAKAGKGGLYRRFGLHYEGKQNVDKLFQ